MTIVRTFTGAELAFEDGGALAVLGDWHGDWIYARKIVNGLNELGVKVLLHTGDFGYWSYDSLFIAQLNKLLRRNGQHLFFVDGNHEHHSLLGELPIVEATGLRHVRKNVFHIPRGAYLDLIGDDSVPHRWLGLGGAVSVDREWRREGVDWFPGEAISDGEHSLARTVPNVEVMITHDAPLGETLKGRYARGNSGFPAADIALSNVHQRKLGDTVEAIGPNFLYHGHHHHRYDELWRGVQLIGLDCNGAHPRANVMISSLDGCPNVELTRKFGDLFS